MNTSAEYIPGLAELGRKNQAGGYVGISSGGDVLGSAALSGTHVVSTICVIPAGNLQFRCGAGCGGNRTQNVTITKPSLRKQQ